MRKNKYTSKEIEILNSNPNVVMVKYGNQIEYTTEFKRWAVLQSLNHPELSANQIFEIAGFDTNIIGKRTAESRIRYWKGFFRKRKELYINPPPKFDFDETDEDDKPFLCILLEDNLDNKFARRKWWKRTK